MINKLKGWLEKSYYLRDGLQELGSQEEDEIWVGKKDKREII